MTLTRAARLWKAANRLGKALEGAVKTLGPIVAALWIAWQYHQSQADKRVEATLGYVTRYENADGSVGKAQRALTASFWDHAGEIGELRMTRATAEQISQVLRTIVIRIIEAAGQASGRTSGSGPFEELDDFYSALATCVQGNVCDEEAALRYFGCATIDFVGNFDQAIRTRQQLASRFGWGVRWMAERARSKGFCTT